MWMWIKNNKFKTLIATLLLVFAIGSFYRSKNPIVAVKKIELKNRVVEKTLSASGKIKSINQVKLSYLSGGKVLKIYVKEGENVAKGQLLAQKVNDGILSDVQALKDARDVTLRDIDLYIEQNESNSDSNEYKIELRRLYELNSKAQATYDSGLTDVYNTYIYAPFDGLIIDIPVQEGETVVASGTILEIADPTKLIFEAEIDQEEYQDITQNMAAHVLLDAFPTEQINGSLLALPQYVDLNSNNFVIQISLPKDTKAVVNMSGDAYVVLESTNAEVGVLGFDEINFDAEEKPFVWALNKNGSAIKKVYIETGLEGDIFTEIKYDLTNETLVLPVNSETQINEGYTVRMVNE
jgi:membrane fusion protein, multidrug efflux system